MAVNFSKKEQVENSKYVGVFEGDVLAINPDKAGLEKLMPGAEIKEEPVYITEKEEDVEGDMVTFKQLNISIWLEDVKTKVKSPLRFFIKNKFKQNKTKTKFQWINNQGS